MRCGQRWLEAEDSWHPRSDSHGSNRTRNDERKVDHHVPVLPRRLCRTLGLTIPSSEYSVLKDIGCEYVECGCPCPAPLGASRIRAASHSRALRIRTADPLFTNQRLGRPAGPTPANKCYFVFDWPKFRVAKYQQVLAGGERVWWYFGGTRSRVTRS
jgi:hypothetical protein